MKKQAAGFKDKKINKEIRELVIMRIQTQISPRLRLSVGNKESLDKEKMIKHVKKGDEIGRQIIETHLNFIKAQATGKLVAALNSV